ncbi:hypothetical protein [Streptomyces uncialis]
MYADETLVTQLDGDVHPGDTDGPVTGEPTSSSPCIEPRHEGAKAWQWEAAPRDGFRVLRHTCASVMLEAGESVVTLARGLGHSSPTVTLSYYAHFMPEAGAKGRTVIDGVLGSGRE